jgi:hypothetical protein
MKPARLLLLVLPAFPFLALAQQQPSSAQEWQRTEETDAFRGTSFSQFTLAGKFLAPPTNHASEAPTLVVQCVAGRHLLRGIHAFTNGKLLSAYLIVGTVLNSHSGEITVQYRLDDGKIQPDWWHPGTDGMAAFLPESALDNLLYGHTLLHKEGTNPPVRKVVISLDEYLASEVVMQFDMPDPTQVAETCGVVYHKK